MEPLQHTVPTGCSSLDKFLGGGLPADGVSLVYGEAETGKTSLAMQCAVGSARRGYKTMFIDSDGTFHERRLSQIAYRDFDAISPFIILVRPTNFWEQALAIDHLDKYETERFGLVVVDTITSLYRVELGAPEENFKLNRELNRQVACLAQISKTRKVATLVTGQVRGILVKGEESMEPVATRVLKFWSDVVINLKNTGQAHVIKAVLEKSPGRKRPASCYLKIEETGIHDYGHYTLAP